MDKDYKFYDSLLNVAIINLYSIGKDTKKISLVYFNPKNKRHLTLYHCALTVRDVFGYEVYLDMSFFEFWWFKLTHKWPKVKRLKGINQLNGPTDDPYGLVDTTSFIDRIELANDSDGIFEDIYNEYYSERKKS